MRLLLLLLAVNAAFAGPLVHYAMQGNYMGSTPQLKRNRAPFWLASQVASDVYRAPSLAGHASIAIICLGGGYSSADLAVAWNISGYPSGNHPTVIDVSIDGAVNAPGIVNLNDLEIALDLQIAGGFLASLSPHHVELVVYFAPNSYVGFYNAIAAAVAARKRIISISWGGDERNWVPSHIAAFDALFAQAVSFGISVFAASGDDGSDIVFYPASSRYVVACGGSTLGSDGPVYTETGWSRSGGGPSSIYFPTRNVPDVAAVSDLSTGLFVYISTLTHGSEPGWYIVGGTSAAAPIWTALWAATISGYQQPVSALDQIRAQTNRLHDITSGSNGNHAAAPGYDLVTGHGSPPRTEPLIVLTDVSLPPAPIFSSSAVRVAKLGVVVAVIVAVSIIG